MKPIFVRLLSLMFALTVIFHAGCGDNEVKRHARGVTLPEGDVETGKSLFVAMRCNRCHTVEGIMLPDQDLPELPKIALGGEIYRVKSYGELVTAIINPQHTVSPQYMAMVSEEEKKSGVESPMLGFNDSMTVHQLIDLVAFLHSRYKLMAPAADEYFYLMP
ncbi:MAG TPA: c-type cytochrome [Verrucomicrobiales bacterium]|nr:c-type cytochrome [Verrucomicrobiales bacterium]